MSKTTPDYAQELRRREPELVALRRDFHRHPELSFAEQRTAEVIAERLHAAGLEVRTGLAGTGVVGVLRGEKPGRTIAWRADIDALPIQETHAFPFASATAGVMHACGHDGHTAIAIHLAEVLAARRAGLTGTAVFIFQPAEEVFGGAQPMIEAGVLDDPRVEEVYGLHLTTQLAVGQVMVRPGPSMASADFFRVEVKGRGGHGAFPHYSVDPITAAAHILVGMQSLITREVAAQETAVMTVGQVQAGTKHNIIPETALLKGSLRTFTVPVRDQLMERLNAFASRIAQAYRAEARVAFEGGGCPAVVNAEPQSARVHRCAADELGAGQVTASQPVMASDDMSLFLQARPGCYFRVGIAPADKPANPHHNPAFEMNEDGLLVGLRVALNVMLDALGNAAS